MYTLSYQYIPVDTVFSSLEEGFGCLIPGYSTITPVISGQIFEKSKLLSVSAMAPDNKINMDFVKIMEAGKVNTNVLKTPTSYTIEEEGSKTKFRFELPDATLPVGGNSYDAHQYEALIAHVVFIKAGQIYYIDEPCNTEITAYGAPLIKVIKNPYETDSAGTPKINGDYRTMQVQVEWYYINVNGAPRKILNAALLGKIKKSGESSYSMVDFTNELVREEDDPSGWRRQTYNIIVPVNKSYTYNFQLRAYDGLSSHSVIIFLASQFKLMDWRTTGKGLAFGKPSEKDAFENNLDLIQSKTAEFQKGTVFRDKVRGIRNGVLIMDLQITAESYLHDSTRFPEAPYVFEIGLFRETLGESIDDTWIPDIYLDRACPDIYPICALESESETGLFNEPDLICLKIYFFKQPTQNINLIYKLTKSMSVEAQNAAGGN